MVAASVEGNNKRHNTNTQIKIQENKSMNT